MKLQLEVPTTWPAEHLADGRRRLVVPPDLVSADAPAPAPANVHLFLRDSLPLPLELAAWPYAAISAVLPAPARRVHLHSVVPLATRSGWPATLAHAALLDERGEQVAGCLAALYRFLAYGAEAIVVATDRARFLALRESLTGILASAQAVWEAGEPASIHHMIHDEPSTP